MSKFLISLDEVERLKRIHDIHKQEDFCKKAGVSRATLWTALTTRRPTTVILEAFARLGARPDRILVEDDLIDAA